MIRDLNLLGLDEQYTTFGPHTINLPIVFPKTTNFDSLKYLLSLGYTCVVSGLFDSLFTKGKSRGTIYIYDVDQLDSYKNMYLDLKLEPVPEKIKERIILSLSLEQI